jgi:signal transduction histidine kinase
LPVRDIIAAAARQVRGLLLDRGFSEDHIDYGKTDEILKSYPRIYVDVNMFQQVVFNLLTNAIKYARDNPREFRVEIRGEKKNNRVFLYFRDYGRGIDETWKEEVFKEGVRVGDAAQVPGRGLGLWVVKKIVTMHNGTVSFTNCKDPTEITISLPVSAGASTRPGERGADA